MTVPAEVVLKIIELTSVEPIWLLHGQGPKFRQSGHPRRESEPVHTRPVGALLRTALDCSNRRRGRGGRPARAEPDPRKLGRECRHRPDRAG